MVYKFLLTGDRFMPEVHLKQPGFTYSAFGPYTKNKQRIQQLKITGDTKYIYKNELDKACFQHDLAYGDFKDLARRTAQDNVLRDKAFNVAKNAKYDEYQRGLASIVYNFFDKKQRQWYCYAKNQPLTEELHKSTTRKFKRGRVDSSFKGNICVVDLADMQLISKFNKVIRFLLCVIDIFILN